jgi:diguanylate cyclase (GGDEF)-like protein
MKEKNIRIYMLNTKVSKMVAVSIIFLFFTFIGNSLISLYHHDKTQYYLEVQSDLLSARYQTSYKYFKLMSQDIYNMYMQNQKLISVLQKVTKASPQEKKLLRVRAYKLLSRNYKRLTNMGISQVHFHLRDNTSFLRMYAPNDYGDDLSKTRNTVVAVNATKKPQEGFEACGYMTGMRFVYPIAAPDKEYIGSVEISFSAQQMLNSITDDYVYDSHILISKKMQTATLVKNELGFSYKETWETPDYLIEESTHKQVKDKNFYNKINTDELRKKISLKIQQETAFSVEFVYNFQHIVLSFHPLSNVNEDKNIAYIVTYTISNYISNLDIEQEYMKMLFFAILGIIYLFSLYIIINREKLKDLALFDALTKLPNRTLFMIEFQNELNRAYRYKNKVALLFIDLDGFKQVNDTYGHHIGDELLKVIGNTLVSTIRKNDIAARLGGDEFMVVLNEVENIEYAQQVANKILEKINEDIILEHKVIHIGASIGISLYPDDSTTLLDLVKFADSAMYEAKNNGKNNIYIYNKEK